MQAATTQKAKFSAVDCFFTFESRKAVSRVRAFAHHASSCQVVSWSDRRLRVRWICETLDADKAVEECRELVDFDACEHFGVEVDSDVHFAGYCN